jgi:carbonic anhydrase/acetyltransferase-like protein (isoleucine patch superfamily)
MKFSLGDKHVQCRGNAYVTPNATVIGDVVLEDQASIWFNAVVRGDNDRITIGARSNVQDGAVLHTDDGLALVLGEDVTVGHLVMLHGCSVGDCTLVGIKSVIMNRAKIGRHCIIGANSLITEGKEIPDRSLVMGAPGKIIREVTDEEIAMIQWNADNYVKKIALYREQLRAAD